MSSANYIPGSTASIALLTISFASLVLRTPLLSLLSRFLPLPPPCATAATPLTATTLSLTLSGSGYGLMGVWGLRDLRWDRLEVGVGRVVGATGGWRRAVRWARGGAGVAGLRVERRGVRRLAKREGCEGLRKDA